MQETVEEGSLSPDAPESARLFPSNAWSLLRLCLRLESCRHMGTDCRSVAARREFGMDGMDRKKVLRDLMRRGKNKDMLPRGSLYSKLRDVGSV